MASVSLKRLIPLGVVVIGLSVALPTGRMPLVAHAQRPTPTNVVIEEPGEEAPQPPPNAAIAGIVYDYSSGAPAPGVMVVLEGGGWGVETVSDDHGNYRFGGLGSGSAVLNLRLPPGAHAVAPDWPVDTRGQGGSPVNLGFYWGDAPPLPVLLTASAEPGVAPVGSQVALTIQVSNRTSEAASGGLVDIKLPSALRATGAGATQGTVDFTGLRVRVSLGDLAPSTQATIGVQVTVTKLAVLNSRTPGLAAPLSETTAVVRTTFTYDQQITPQVLLTSIQLVTADAPTTEPPPPGAPASEPTTAPTVTLKPSPTSTPRATPTVEATTTPGEGTPATTDTPAPATAPTSMPPTGVKEPLQTLPFMWLAAGVVVLGLLILASAVVLVARGQ